MEIASPVIKSEYHSPFGELPVRKKLQCLAQVENRTSMPPYCFNPRAEGFRAKIEGPVPKMFIFQRYTVVAQN